MPQRRVEFVDADDYAAMLNRSAIIVRVKQPFIDWANSLDDGPTASLDTYEPTLLLIDDLEELAEWTEAEARIWERIFAHQLASWHRDPSEWPQARTLNMFRKWIDVELHLGVHDAGDDPMIEL